MKIELSPAAQAVLDAFLSEWNVYAISEARWATAAALRAAADHVAPHIEEPDWGACEYMKCDIELYTDHQRKRAELLAIATELEAQS